MPRYIIHIGPPKTGTKYIQFVLNRLRDQLECDGISYPNDLWTVPHHFSHEQLVQLLRDGKASSLEPLFDRLNHSQFHTILLSCEGFTALTREELLELKRLIGENAVSIVYYCRRWSDWIPSAWQESVRQGNSLSLPHFLLRFMTSPLTEQEINFDVLLRKFSDAFGISSLMLFSYSNIEDREVDILDSFLSDVLGVAYNTNPFRNLHPNASDSSEETEILRILNAREVRVSGSAKFRFKGFMEKVKENDPIIEDINFLRDAINSNASIMTIDDNAPWLRSVYEQLTEKYADKLLGAHEAGQGTSIFQRRARSIQFNTEAYLLDPNVLNAIGRLHIVARRNLAGF